MIETLPACNLALEEATRQLFSGGCSILQLTAGGWLTTAPPGSRRLFVLEDQRTDVLETRSSL